MSSRLEGLTRGTLAHAPGVCHECVWWQSRGNRTASKDRWIDRAEEELSALREAWTDMAAGERTIVGRTAAPMRARLDRLRTRLPKRTALSEGAPERDPDEEIDPAQAA